MKWVIKSYEQTIVHSLLLPSLPDRQHVSLWHIEGRGVAIRIGSILKQHRVFTSNLEENHVCAYSFSDPLWILWSAVGKNNIRSGQFQEATKYGCSTKDLLHIQYTYIRWLLMNDSTIEACGLRVECQHQLRK